MPENTRYKVIFRKDSEKTLSMWAPGCPAYLEAVQVVRDTITTKTYLQFKIKNISSKVLERISYTAKITLEDDSKSELSDALIDFDLPAGGEKNIGPIELTSPYVTQASVELDSIKLGDGSGWTYDPDATLPDLVPLELSEEASAERSVQLRSMGVKKPENLIYEVVDTPDYWVCSCGFPNVSTAGCCNCGANHDSLVSLEDETFLKEKAMERKKLKEEKERKAAERKAKLKEYRKKALKIAIPIAVVVVIFLIVGFTTKWFGLARMTNDYSWEELSNISEEISAAPDENAAIEIAKKYHLVTDEGKLDGTQTKSFQLSDGTNAEVQITGFCHDDKSDGSGKAGITFIFKDAIAKREMNSTDTNAGGWEKSQMRSWLASDVLGMLPRDLREELVEVNKLTDTRNTSDKLWLYSTSELYGEGYKLYRDTDVKNTYSDYSSDSYAAKESHPIDILIKDYDGLPIYWWTRTCPSYRKGSYYYSYPYYSSYYKNYEDFYEVDINGYTDFAAANYLGPLGNADCSGGVVPGFCI